MVTYDPAIRKYAVSMKKKGLDIFITVEKNFFLVLNNRKFEERYKITICITTLVQEKSVKEVCNYV